jgi:hypothetical protein
MCEKKQSRPKIVLRKPKNTAEVKLQRACHKETFWVFRFVVLVTASLAGAT